MKTTTLNCKVRKRKTGYEGTVSIAGLQETKLVKSSDGTSVYSTQSAVETAAKACASRLGLEIVFDAKKTSKKTTSKNESNVVATAQEM